MWWEKSISLLLFHIKHLDFLESCSHQVTKICCFTILSVWRKSILSFFIPLGLKTLTNATMLIAAMVKVPATTHLVLIPLSTGQSKIGRRRPIKLDNHCVFISQRISTNKISLERYFPYLNVDTVNPEYFVRTQFSYPGLSDLSYTWNFRTVADRCWFSGMLCTLRMHFIFVRKAPCTKYTKITCIRNILDLQYLIFENQTRNDAATAVWSDLTDRFRGRSIDERDSRPRRRSLHCYGNSKRLRMYTANDGKGPSCRLAKERTL